MRKLMMIALVLLVATSFATAQRGHGDFAELKLTAEQREQIQSIRAESRARMQELRQQSPEQRPDREAMKKLRAETQGEIEALLTAEQRRQLADIRAERAAARKAVDKEALKADLEAHRETRVKPVLAAARAQFDQFISAEDKATLERLRPIFATKPDGKKAGGHHRGERPTEAEISARKKAASDWRAAHAAEIAEMKALTKKYAADLERIRERMAPQREQWRKEKREIMANHRPDHKGNSKKAGTRAGKRPHRAADKKKREKKTPQGWPRGAAFLLMKG